MNDKPKDNTIGFLFHFQDMNDWILFHFQDMNEPANFITGRIQGCPKNSYEHPPYWPCELSKLLPLLNEQTPAKCQEGASTLKISIAEA